MADTKRIVIGSEIDDTKKIELDRLGGTQKIAVPVAMYDTNGSIINGPGMPTALTASAPTSATVGTSSIQVLATNTSRKGAVFINTSTNVISFGIGTAAVLNKGITLKAFGTWVMDQFTYTTSAINAVASGAASNLAIQEFN